MYLTERIKKDREILKSLPGKKEKLTYIWDYYKVPLITLAVVLVICVGSLISNVGKQKEIMTVVLLNNDSAVLEVNEEVFIEQLEKADVDVKNKKVEVIGYLKLSDDPLQDTSQDLLVLNSLFTFGDLDIFIGEQQYFDMFAQKDGFIDLNEVLSSELLKKYDADLYRYNNTEDAEIAGGLILHADSIIHKANYYHNDVVIGIASKSGNKENAIAFLNQILSD